MDIRPYIPLNFGIMANGYNWIVLVLMVTIAGLGLALIFPAVTAPNGAKSS